MIVQEFKSKRRKAIKGIALTAASLLLTPSRVFSLSQIPPLSSIIIDENKKSGTTNWMLKNPKINKSGVRCSYVEGYCSQRSVTQGEKLNFFVSTNPNSEYYIDIYRMGYYGGKGGRHLKQLGPFFGIPQPNATEDYQCQWNPSAEITIPKEWVSGVYLAKITEQRHMIDSYMIFIVKDNRSADFNFQCSDMTWQAYNKWPHHHAIPNDERDWSTNNRVNISIDRPYGKYTDLIDQPLTTGSGEFLLWEFPFCFWLEKKGFDVTYTSNWDTHYDGVSQLMRTKGWLSVGHDECWTEEMMKNVQKAVNNGLNVGFFSGHSAYQKIKLSSYPQENKGRIFRQDRNFTEEENSWIGSCGLPSIPGGADWACADEEHWIFEGTGMKNGDAIPGLVGWKYNSTPANIPGLKVIAHGETDGRKFKNLPVNDNLKGTYSSTIHQGLKNNIIFNAGTIWWADGLSKPPGYKRSKLYIKRNGPDARVEQITTNILNMMVLNYEHSMDNAISQQ